MRIAVVKGRATRPAIKIGICGEHGGDPPAGFGPLGGTGLDAGHDGHGLEPLNTIEFSHQLEQDYASCSPFRVPVARLAAAQAVIKSSRPDRGRSGKSKAAGRR